VKIEFIRCVIDEGNAEAPLTILIDGKLEKDIPWRQLDELMNERASGIDAHHTPEQALLARLACDSWVDCDLWWEGVSGEAPDELASTPPSQSPAG
jgi:hypothetical protein